MSHLISAIDYAYIADHCYSEEQGGAFCTSVGAGSNLKGWTVTLRHPSKGNGFGGAVYKRGTTIVVAFAGTDDKKDLLGADLKMGLNRVPEHQLSMARELFKMAKSQGSQLSVCGHSLGGALALLLGTEVGVEVVSFNAPRILPSIMKNKMGRMTPMHTYNYTFGKDIVSGARKGANFDFGHYIQLNPSNIFSKALRLTQSPVSLIGVKDHFMSNILSAISKHPKANKPPRDWI